MEPLEISRQEAEDRIEWLAHCGDLSDEILLKVLALMDAGKQFVIKERED